jgi:hypothetical protein
VPKTIAYPKGLYGIRQGHNRTFVQARRHTLFYMADLVNVSVAFEGQFDFFITYAFPANQKAVGSEKEFRDEYFAVGSQDVSFPWLKTVQTKGQARQLAVGSGEADRGGHIHPGIGQPDLAGKRGETPEQPLRKGYGIYSQIKQAPPASEGENNRPSGT